ncbi:hypothetical protein LSCM1_08052 [Leishmania martiniquensis]|uniref:Leucine-rich repeat protein n=1 Tax=Leishmania martiniquensis TaxID=1580590 RepID=A0A836HA82_9TRYP|nr:hypothetical protein LSCM1_08052 [Leishmania martiniquensis]
MSVATSSSRGSGGSEEVEVCGRGRGIRAVDLPAVFTTPQEREMLCVITAFDLSRNELQELTNLQPLRSLTRLNASYNRISFVDGLPLRLTQLNLAHNKLEHLDHVSQLVHLRELDVSFNRLTSLAGLHPRIPLEVLRADDNRISRTSGLKELSSLRVASLSNNYVEDVDELLFVSTTPSLQLLNLAGNPVTRARRYRQTLAELQPSLVSLDGAPLTRADDYEVVAPGSRGKSSGMSSAAAHTPAPFSTASMGATRPQRTLACSSHGSEKKTMVAAEVSQAPSTALKSLDSSANNPSSCRGRFGGAAQSVVAHRSIGLASAPLDDCDNVRPREQPPQPLRRATASPTARALHRPATGAPRVALTGHRRLGAGSPHNDSSAAEPPQSVNGSPAPAEHRTEAAYDTNSDVPSAGESSSRGCRVTEHSLRSPERGSRQVGYASLHSTPAIGSTADRLRSSGRARLLPAPASALRSSAAQQATDSTTAQLHDSLVAKEQLEKECQTLRRSCKRLEGQLAEARRVISQQLAELSQLRLERDALRQSEGTALELLEKEQRSGRTRASHHSDEVATLQEQYERMKTFYETQLADTRRELAAERARLLRRSNSGSNGERKAVAADSDDVAGQGKATSFSDQGQRAGATAGSTKSEPAAAGHAGSSRCRSPPPSAASSATSRTGDDGPATATSPTDSVAQQLTSLLYASLTGNGHAADGDESVGATSLANELCRSLLADLSSSAVLANQAHQSKPQESADAVKDSGNTRAAAARHILERCIAQYVAQQTRLPQPTVGSNAHAQSPTATASRTDAPTPGDVGGTAVSQGHELAKVIETSEAAVTCPLPQRLPSPSPCPSPPPADQAPVKDDGVDTDADTEATVIISAPALSAIANTGGYVADVASPSSPRFPTSTHDRRVDAAKALLKEMEPLFNS